MYAPLSLPYGFDFKSLTLDQANENAWVFIKQIPERLRILGTIVRDELPAWRADLSDGSLSSLGAWYSHHVEERELNECERDNVLTQLDPSWQFLADVEKPFTDRTVAYGLDIGIYVGECIRARCPATVWKRGKNPKSTLNKPVLAGFETKAEYDPFDMGNYAARVISRARLHNQPRSTKTPETVLEHASAMIAKLPRKDPMAMLGERLVAWVSSAM